MQSGECGVRSVGSGVKKGGERGARSAKCVAWSGKAWCVECGARSVKSLWCVVPNVKCRVWSLECRARHLACEVHSVECKSLAATACV